LPTRPTFLKNIKKFRQIHLQPIKNKSFLINFPKVPTNQTPQLFNKENLFFNHREHRDHREETEEIKDRKDITDHEYLSIILRTAGKKMVTVHGKSEQMQRYLFYLIGAKAE
jgi:hypothetical protein